MNHAHTAGRENADAPRKKGRRITQTIVDRMAELRRQGVTFVDIGARVGRSERTARRYVGHVQPQVVLPGAQQETESDNPKELRATLEKRLAMFLHRGWEKWPSAAFLAETNRVGVERLAQTDVHTLRLLVRDAKVWNQFIMEVVGPLYKDFAACRRIHETMQQVSFSHEPFLWQPPRERPAPKDDDEGVE